MGMALGPSVCYSRRRQGARNTGAQPSHPVTRRGRARWAVKPLGDRINSQFGAGASLMFIRLPAVGLSMIGVVLAVVMRDANPALLVTVLLGGAVLLDAALAPSPRRFEVDRSGAATARVGESVPAQLTITNPGRWPMSGQIRDAWPPSTGVDPSRHSLRIAGGRSHTVDTTLTPTRRGTIVITRDHNPNQRTLRPCWTSALISHDLATQSTAAVRIAPPYSLACAPAS